MGVSKEIIQEGHGECPRVGQKVTVHCVACLADGTQFWTTRSGAGAKTFSWRLGVDSLIRGWAEAAAESSLRL